jgi:hypothetical protein
MSIALTYCLFTRSACWVGPREQEHHEGYERKHDVEMRSIMEERAFVDGLKA